MHLLKLIKTNHPTKRPYDQTRNPNRPNILIHKPLNNSLRPSQDPIRKQTRRKNPNRLKKIPGHKNQKTLRIFFYSSIFLILIIF